jgi:hypothetical protein
MLHVEHFGKVGSAASLRLAAARNLPDGEDI